MLRVWLSVSLLLAAPVWAAGQVSPGAFALTADGLAVRVDQVDGALARVQPLPGVDGPPMWVAAQSLIPEVASQVFAPGRYVLQEPLKLASILAHFVDDRILLSNQAVRHADEVRLAKPVRSEGADEQGRMLFIEAELEGGDVIVWPMDGEGHRNRDERYLRPRKGLRTLPSLEKQLEIISRELGLNELSHFENLRNGQAVDSTNPASLALLRLYIQTQMVRGANPTSFVNKALAEVWEFTRRYELPSRPRLASAIVRTSTRGLRLRQLPPDLAPFRGCLGADCSTHTRLLRALEPAHVNFAIEDIPYRPIGQIEVILGHEGLAFLERVQSPLLIRSHELAGLLTALVRVLKDAGYTLVMLPRTIYGKLGHDISNYFAIMENLDSALAAEFAPLTPSVVFRRYADQIFDGDINPINLIAHKAERAGERSGQLIPKRDVPERVVSIAVEREVLSTEPVDAAALRRQLLGKVLGLRDSQKGREMTVSQQAWAVFLSALNTCEARMGGD